MKNLCRSLLIFWLLASTPVWADAKNTNKPLSIGQQTQLFVDDYIIAKKNNVTRTLNQAKKANDGKPVLVADRPWETDNILIGSVFRENGKFKMFYKVGYSKPAPNDPPGTPQLAIAYAESTDGIHWTKPDLGIRTFQGSKNNNLIEPMGMTCFPDPHETDPQHKYKAAYSHWGQMKAALAHSADGLHWTPYNNGNPVTHRAADTINQLLWDSHAQTYRLYTRTDYQQRLRAKIEVRGTRDMTNPDVKANPTDWKTVREWTFDRTSPTEYKRRQTYSLNGWIYRGLQFGLIWSYDWPTDLSEGPHDLHKRHERDVMNCYLVATRNNQPWNFEWIYAEKPLISRGPDGSFDKDWIQPAINVVTWKNKHWIFYSGARERHDVKGPRPVAIGLATLPQDRIVAIQTKPNSNGTITTKPFQLDGVRLKVNVDASQGRLLVEILDATGQPIKNFSADDCQSVAVDAHKQGIIWSDGAALSSIKGQTVQLRFHLIGPVKLFAFAIN